MRVVYQLLTAVFVLLALWSAVFQAAMVETAMQQTAATTTAVVYAVLARIAQAAGHHADRKRGGPAHE